MLVENISIAQYPKINWSREYQHQDGDPADTFGLIGIRIGPDGWRMDHNRGLTPYKAPSMRDSLLIFGAPRSSKLWIYSHSERLFDFEDPERINLAGKLAQDLVVAANQMIAAERVMDVGQRFLATLDNIAVEGDPELVQQAGMIAKFVASQRRKLSPENTLKAAQNLLDSGVTLVEAQPSQLNRRPELRDIYDIEGLIKQYSTPEPTARIS